ncbi:MAG: RES family NAD+ phosphorylase [Xanthobacteraceae bacterium]
MRLWRLSSVRRAFEFNGGYGISNNGRWNTLGRPTTYCSTVPSLAALEKRVHVTDPALLPPQVMVAYEVPDDIAVRTIDLDELPANWTSQETTTQAIGDGWLDTAVEVLLFVPSVVMPMPRAPDRNVLINHRVAKAASIKIAETLDFTLDPRLFRP